MKFLTKKDLNLVLFFLISTIFIFIEFIFSLYITFSNDSFSSLIDNYFIIFFTILGIIVTLISISLSLTNEIKQNLSINFILKNKISYFFFTFLLSSFLWGLFFVYYFEKITNELYFLFSLSLLFFISFWYVWWFINILNRDSFYDYLFKQFRVEFKRFQNFTNIETLEELSSVDSFIENINYNASNLKDLNSEKFFLRNLYYYILKSDDENKLELFYILNGIFARKANNKEILIKMISLLNEIRDEHYFENKIGKIEFIKKENNYVTYDKSFIKFKFIKFPQNSINNLFQILINFPETRNYINNFNYDSGLFIHNYLYHEIIKENNLDNVKNYFEIVNNTNLSFFEILKNSLNFKFNYEKNKIDIFKKLIQDYIKLIEFLPDNEYLYNSKYLDLEENSKERELIDFKVKNSIKINKEINENVLKLLFIMMDKIYNNKLDKSFFSLCYEIYLLNFKEYYNKDSFDDIIDFFDRDITLKDRGASIYEKFDYIKYRLILTYFNFLKKGKIDIIEYHNSFFEEFSSKDWIQEINELRFVELNNFFTQELKEFKDFKKKCKFEINKKIKSVKKFNYNKIESSELDASKTKNFKEQVKENLFENDLFRNVLKDNFKIKTNEQIDTKFGLNAIIDKEYYIKGSNWAQTLGSDIGFRIGFDKTLNICKEIVKNICPENKLSMRDINKIFDSELIKDDEEYILFLTSKANLYKIRDFEFLHNNKLRYENGYILKKSKKIRVFTLPIEKPFLFELGSFKLIQYGSNSNGDEINFSEFKEIKEKEKIKISCEINESYEINILNKKFIWELEE